MIRILGLVALVWCVYWNSLHNPFVFDDFYMIVGNPAVTGPADLWAFVSDPFQFTTLPRNRDYRPLFLVSMSLCWWLGGGDTLPFHALSVTLHLGNVLLLFFLMRFLLTQSRYGFGSGTSSAKEWTAFFAAALFAVHPLTTQAVNFLTQQAVLVMAFFYLLSFYLFIRVYGSDLPSPAQTSLKFGSYAAYALALLGKAPAFTLPLNLLMWECLFGAASGPGPSGSLHRPSPWARLHKHLPFFAVSAGYYLLRNLLFAHDASRMPGKRPSTLDWLTQTTALVLYYLRRALLPFDLSVDPAFPPVQSGLDLRVPASFLILGGILWWLIRYRREKLIVFWALWFPVCLLVTSYLIRLNEVVNEHRAYLPLVGIAALAGLVSLRLTSRTPAPLSHDNATDLASLARPLVAPLLIVILGIATVSRNHVWSSGLTLWEDAVLKDGTAKSHMNYGLALDQAGRPDEALQQFREAFDLSPNVFSHLNLGLALMGRGATSEALTHLSQAVEANPSLVQGRLALASGLERAGLMDEAEKELKDAVQLNPKLPQPFRSLGAFCERREDWIGAMWAYRELLKISPDPKIAQKISSPAFLLQVGLAFDRAGKREEAVNALEALVRENPSHDEGRFRLALVYLDGDSPADWERSEELLRQVLGHDSRGYAEALYYLGTAMRRLGRIDEAKLYDRLYLERGGNLELVEKARLRLTRADSR